MQRKNPRLPEATLERARRLRRDCSFPERVLWQALRGNRLANLKFRRQHPCGCYFVDFHCEQHSLVIEVDGNSHADRGQYDLQRQQFLEAQGLQVLRVGNDDVLKDLDSVLLAILLACGISPDEPASDAKPSETAARLRPVRFAQSDKPLGVFPHPGPLPEGEGVPRGHTKNRTKDSAR